MSDDTETPDEAPAVDPDDLLPPDSAYPDGYDVSREDLPNVQNPESAEFTNVDPPECAPLTDHEPDLSVLDEMEMAAQLAEPEDLNPIYTFVVFTDVPPESEVEDELAGVDEELLAHCSDMTVEDTDTDSVFHMSLDYFHPDAPGVDGAFSTTTEGTGMASQVRLTARFAVGEMNDVHFLLTSVRPYAPEESLDQARIQSGNEEFGEVLDETVQPLLEL
ncbi:hypothetical protein RIF23_12245 [Lipingzhangella sp. LS1_29]|uniref:Uncharacterized protein n=1 Tax=Lipingzhangella rawalii TaxID=2055835 RepID=A0ABU2H8Y7_9ACTN|nr:hypothetical protein [Lipingzhangella rawalii]MDS1271069.1 hypothetical protein [Lipingzhangella rawalii]